MFRSAAQSCQTLCNSMNCSTLGFPVHHQLSEFAQTHIHRVSDAIQPSHPVIPFSFFFQSVLASEAVPVSWFFTSGGQSIGASASVLPFNIQDVFPLGLTCWNSFHSKFLSRVYSHTTVKNYQFFDVQFSFFFFFFFDVQFSLWSKSSIHT